MAARSRRPGEGEAAVGFWDAPIALTLEPDGGCRIDRGRRSSDPSVLDKLEHRRRRLDVRAYARSGRLHRAVRRGIARCVGPRRIGFGRAGRLGLGTRRVGISAGGVRVRACRLAGSRRIDRARRFVGASSLSRTQQLASTAGGNETYRRATSLSTANVSRQSWLGAGSPSISVSMQPAAPG